MPDPIWRDNNIVDRAWKGDVDVRAKLAEFRGQGRKLLIAPWVKNECIEGDWTADTGGKAFGKDRVAGLRALVACLKGVKADKGAVKTFDTAAHAYVEAMGGVVEKLAALRIDLDPIAADIGRRADFLGRTGTYLEDLFWEVIPVAAAVPVAYCQWLDVHNLAGLFERLGGRVDGLASEIRAVAASYDHELEALYAELQANSEALVDFGERQ